MIDASVMKRLAIIKYLYQKGVEQSQKSEFISSLSVLNFHDSIDLFMQLAAEFLGIDIKKKKTFLMDYFKIIANAPNGKKLTQKEGIKRLNRSRVDLKHYGIMPSKLNIEAFRACVTNFYTENTLLIFGFDFNFISMIDLVQCSEARENLELADKLKKQGDLQEALTNVAIAFEQIIEDYKKQESKKFGSVSFPSLNHSFVKPWRVRDVSPDFAEFVADIRDYVKSMEKALDVLSLDINYRKYIKFKQLTPYVAKSGNKWAYSKPIIKKTLGIEDFNFCFNFVIDTAIRLLI